MKLYSYVDITQKPHGTTYDASQDDGTYQDAADIFSSLAGNIYELGVDALPDGVADIRGLIHNGPERVFYCDQSGYFGLRARSTKKPLIILEVPHSGKPKAWMALGDQDFINCSGFHDNPDFEYTELFCDPTNPDEVEDVAQFFEDDIIPDDVMEIFKKEQLIIEIYRNGELSIYPPSEAPSEFDIAMEALEDDLRDLRVLTVNEAKHFVADTSQPEAYRSAVETVLKDYF